MTQAIEVRGDQVKTFLMAHAADFQKVIPSHMSPDRMMRIALSAINTTPHLADCTIQSVAVSLMGCSSLGLEPNTPSGHAYLIPYNCSVKDEKGNWKKQWRCQLIVGYKGYIELFYRSGAVSRVQSFPVYDGDNWSYTMGTDERIIHVASESQNREDPAKMHHAYCIVRMKDPGVLPILNVMSRMQIDAHMERTQSREWTKPGKPITGPWITDYVKMALKTTVRDVVPWVPNSIEKPAVAAAFELSSERREPYAALTALGPDTLEVAGNLLSGIPEDQPAIEGEIEETESAVDKLKAELKTKAKREPGDEG